VAIAQYRAEREPGNLRNSALRVAAAVAAAALVVAFLLWALRVVDRALERRYHDRIQTVGVQSFEIVRAERIRGVIRGSISFLRLVVLAIVLFALLDYALLQFPWTRQTALGLLGAVVAPVKVMAAGLLAQIPNLAFLVVLVVVVRFLLRLMRLFFEAVASGRVMLKDFEPGWAEPTYKLLRIFVVGFGLIVAYPYIPGSASDAFKGISIFVGVVFSLASTTAISNMIAGYALIYRRAFKVGDRIRVGDVTGVVTVSRLQVTHLRTVKNEEVIVPNSQMLNGTIVNYSSFASDKGLAVSVTAGIGYETPWRQVEAMLLLAAERTEGVLREPGPFVWHLSLGDFCVNYELNAFVADALAAPVVRTALSRNVLDVFNEYGVQIMTPAYRGDPEEPKIVRREDWHLPPASPAKGVGVQGQGTGGDADTP
jgi:small-conductance mechanosensitive channel